MEGCEVRKRPRQPAACSWKVRVGIFLPMRMSGTVAAVSLSVLIALPLGAQDRTGGAPGCADPLAVVIAFYDATDAGNYDAGAKLLTVHAKVDTWASGVQGYVLAKRHIEGRNEIRRHLADTRGLRRHLPDSAADGPAYFVDRIKVIGNTVQLMLEPDRKRPNGKLYNPFSVEAALDGCLISSLTVIERVTWL
jgi:hypothetical protein